VTVKATVHPELVPKLKSLGYRAEVAERIASTYPDLAKSIVETNDPPVTVYRGLGSTKLEALDLAYRSEEFGGYVYVATNPLIAQQYATGRTSRSTPDALVLEFQVPRSIAQLAPEPYYAPTDEVGNIDQRVVPDLTPFLTRVQQLKVKLTTDYMQRVNFEIAESKWLDDVAAG
jgi:hypothetical protein